MLKGLNVKTMAFAYMSGEFHDAFRQFKALHRQLPYERRLKMILAENRICR